MATWTNIQTTRLEPGKPIRSIDGIALRDNPIAIAEGASGAPRVQTNGIANSAVTTAKIANSAVTNGKIANNTIQGSKFNDSSVRSWIGSQNAGAVGTYAFVTKFYQTTTLIINWNETVAGSDLRRASVGLEGLEYDQSGSLSGTWRIMGQRVATDNQGQAISATLALRIS